MSQTAETFEKLIRCCGDGDNIEIYKGGALVPDKNKLTKLLKLDSAFQCKKAIDKFVYSKALKGSKLNWFQEIWNWIAIKITLGRISEKKKAKLRSNKFIPKSDETKN